MKLKTIAAAAALLALPVVSQAGDVAGFTTGGYVDFSGQVNDWDDNTASLGFTNIGNDGDLSLNQVAFKLSKTPSTGFGAVIGVVGGDAAGAIPGNAGGGDLRLSEGYVQYANGP